MVPNNFQSFIHILEKEGELHRIKTEVDPYLEITEISIKAQLEGKPAILFENVKGSKFPLAINTLASAKRIELALGEDPSKIGENIINFVDSLNPPSVKSLWSNRKMIPKLLSTFPKTQRKSEVSGNFLSNPNLSDLPLLHCWPEDGGKFITLPLVVTQHPQNDTYNIGIYRMHMYDSETTGMHMQIEKGGGFHHYQAEQMGKPLELAVAIGGDPALILSAIMPLPEGLSEIQFCGFLRGSRTKLLKCKTIDLKAPAESEFILEGYLNPNERKLEGPFGDHFGHYSESSEFPVFHINAIQHKNNPIYPATVVGKPPQEDKFMGDCTQSILGPLIKLIHPEIRSTWAYFEAGFHNLLVISTENRYTREPFKTALGLLGQGQLSLSKTIILVNSDVDVKNKSQILQEIRKNFNPKTDFLLLNKTPIDTLDFTGESMHKGSKMIIDATGYNNHPIQPVPIPKDIRNFSDQIIDWRFIGNTLLAISSKGIGKNVINKLLSNKLLESVKMIVCLSEDVDIHNDIDLVWGIFTRFDPASDITFRETTLQGISPFYDGTMFIDATWKKGYQKPLVMDQKIINKVESKWESYWK